MNTTLFDKIYKDYEKGWLMTLNDPLTKEEFLQKLKSDKSFAESWGIVIKERMLTYPERYRIWFQNNFETGMEYCLEIAPEFGDEYYEPTPTKLITITYNDIKTEIYE